MKLLKLVLISVVAFVVVFFSHKLLPDRTKVEISNWYGRLNAPIFDLPPDTIVRTEQAALIAEYQRRGYTLKCYGDLRPEEKIEETDDHECVIPIKSAYDNVPSKLAVFFFSKGQLSHVRMEFPASSFDKLQDYLNRRMANFPRLDQRPDARFGTDVFGKPLIVWGVKGGIVVTSAATTPNQPLILLWSGTR